MNKEKLKKFLIRIKKENQSLLDNFKKDGCDRDAFLMTCGSVNTVALILEKIYTGEFDG